MRPRFTIRIAVLLLLSGIFSGIAARADSFTNLASVGTTSNSDQYSFDGSTISIARNGAWAAALPGSSWVSFESAMMADASQSGNTYRTCPDVSLGCVNQTMIVLPASDLHSGSNTWEFEVAKRDGSPDGLDYAAPLTDPLPTPEPASLILFGSGMLGVAWLVRRSVSR
jgi:PEP-CTERM motif